MSYISQNEIKELQKRVNNLEKTAYSIISIGTISFCIMCIGVIYAIIH